MQDQESSDNSFDRLSNDLSGFPNQVEKSIETESERIGRERESCITTSFDFYARNFNAMENPIMERDRGRWSPPFKTRDEAKEAKKS